MYMSLPGPGRDRDMCIYMLDSHLSDLSIKLIQNSSIVGDAKRPGYSVTW